MTGDGGAIMPRRERAAYHEASHAVIGHSVGGYVLSLRLDPGEVECVFEQYVGSNSRRDSRVPVYLAGPTAAMILAIERNRTEHDIRGHFTGVVDVIVDTMGDAESGIFAEEVGNDLAVALDLIGSADRGLWREHAAVAESLVLKHWPIIQAVGASLLVRGHMSAHDFQSEIQPWIDRGALPPITDNIRSTRLRSSSIS